MSEKRIYERSPIELAASYGIPEAVDLNEAARVVNISEGGFCFLSSKKIPSGEKFDLCVELDDNESVTLEVKAVWNKKMDRKYMIGVKILNSTGADYEKFLSFYNQQIEAAPPSMDS